VRGQALYQDSHKEHPVRGHKQAVAEDCLKHHQQVRADSEGSEGEQEELQAVEEQPDKGEDLPVLEEAGVLGHTRDRPVGTQQAQAVPQHQNHLPPLYAHEPLE
jgi:hypothetical protein